MQEQSLPPPPIAQRPLLLSVSDIPPDPDGSLPWWKPTWRDIALRLGWRWLYVIPLLLLLLVLAWAIFARFWFLNVLLYGGKLWLWLGAAVMGAVVQAMRKGTQARREPFCIHCGYTLAGLPDHHICPECGRPYSFDLIRQYQQDPKWFVQRWEARTANPINVPFHAGTATHVRQNDGT